MLRSFRSKLICTSHIGILILALWLPTALFGRAISQISGTIADASGTVVPDVAVTVTQTETGLTRATTADNNGSFLFTNLPLGPYRLTANKTGFRPFTQTGIVLQVNSNPTVPIVLTVGGVSETVEVQANATQIETRAMGVGSVVETQRILDLPLNGRDPTSLILLAGAGVQTGSSPSYTMKTGILISVAGGLQSGLGYFLDGTYANDPYDSTGLPLPFPDALQEFKVETSSLTAQNGIKSSAAISAVTKSGTNALHGNVFEFVRNQELNARNFFLPRRDTLKRNQFGGTVGGPVIKDKLFFFAGYQATTIRQTLPQAPAFVPTAAMRAGDFSAYVAGRCGAALGGTLASSAGVIDSTHISPSSLSPAAVKYAARLPAPVNDCGQINYSIQRPENDGQAVGRLDYQLNSNQSLFVRFLATTQHAPVPYSLDGNLLNTNNGGLDDLAQSAAVGHTWLINATTVNSFRLAMNRVATSHPGAKSFRPADIGINAYTPTVSFAVTVPGAFGTGLGIGQDLVGHTTVGVLDVLQL